MHFPIHPPPLAYSPPPCCSSCPPHPRLSLSLLSHKQQSCQTAGPPKRAARLSTSEHWKPATGAMKYIKSFPSECTCTFTCSRECSVCVCVFDHLNAGDINIDPRQPLKLASKTLLIPSPLPKAQPHRSSEFPLTFGLFLAYFTYLFCPRWVFFSPTAPALILYPIQSLLCLQVFAFWLPPAACICCLSSFPRQGSDIGSNKLYLCSVPPVSAGSLFPQTHITHCVLNTFTPRRREASKCSVRVCVLARGVFAGAPGTCMNPRITIFMIDSLREF